MKDRLTIMNLFENGEVFQTLPHTDRLAILDRVLAVPGRIPSLFTFLEDTKYLEPCAKAMRTLFPPKTGRTISMKMQNCYLDSSGDSSANIEYSEQVYADGRGLASSFEMAYRQVWLFTLRRFPELTGKRPRLDNRKVQQRQYGVREDVWTQFALIAARMGFSSSKIRELQGDDPRLRLSLSFLSRYFPIEEYHAPDRHEVARNIVQNLALFTRRPPLISTPALSQDIKPLEDTQRHGTPFTESYNLGKKALFIPYVYGLRETVPKLYMTPFAIQRDIFFCFFGYPSPEDLQLFSRFLPPDSRDRSGADNGENSPARQLRTRSGVERDNDMVENEEPSESEWQDALESRNSGVGDEHEYTQRQSSLQVEDTGQLGGDAESITGEDIGSPLQRLKLAGGTDYGPFRIPIEDVTGEVRLEMRRFALILYDCEDQTTYLLPGSPNARTAGLVSITTPRDNRCHYISVEENRVRYITVRDVHDLSSGLVLIGQEGRIRILDSIEKKNEVCFLRSLIGPFNEDCLDEILAII